MQMMQTILLEEKFSTHTRQSAVAGYLALQRSCFHPFQQLSDWLAHPAPLLGLLQRTGVTDRGPPWDQGVCADNGGSFLLAERKRYAPPLPWSLVFQKHSQKRQVQAAGSSQIQHQVRAVPVHRKLLHTVLQTIPPETWNSLWMVKEHHSTETNPVNNKLYL